MIIFVVTVMIIFVVTVMNILTSENFKVKEN